MSKTPGSVDKRDHYKSYCKRASAKGRTRLSEKQHSQIITLLGLKRVEALLADGRLDFSNGMGHLAIEKRIPTHAPLDKSQLQFGKRVRLMNFHSDGYIYVVVWHSPETYSKKRRFYNFKTSDVLRQALKEKIFRKEADYPESM